MNKLLLAVVAGTTAVAPATPALAHPSYHYVGGCDSAYVISDGTNNAQTMWEGEIRIAAVATDSLNGVPAAVNITVECELRINGAAPGTLFFAASGTTVAKDAAVYSYNADPDDIVTICENVTVDQEFHKDCVNGPTPPFVTPLYSQSVNEVACEPMRSLAFTAADQPPVFDVRTDGDIFINRRWVWDCPVYTESGT